jgi:prephenate dehydrogenase
MKIGVIGLGLLGGSILKSLRLNVKGVQLVGITNSSYVYEWAQEYADLISKDINDVHDCDVVFVCNAISNIIVNLDRLEDIVSSKCIVSDIASVKEQLSKKSRPYIYIGGHPMAGTQLRGFENSFPEMFIGAKWVLTPKKTEDKKHIDKLAKLINAMGAEILITTPKDHDAAVAKISHMPALLSHALIKMARYDDLAMNLAAGGFRDMTRIAMQNTDMVVDMKRFNSKNIAAAIDRLKEAVVYLENLNPDTYMNEISKTKIIRREMYNDNGVNIWQDKNAS